MMRTVEVSSSRTIVSRAIENKVCVSTQRGFTMVELLVTISIIGILSAIALPSFEGVLLSYKLRSYSNALVASVHLARGEAIKSNTTVLLCASTNGTSCGGVWRDGWIVLRGTTVAQRLQGIATGYKITDSGGLTSLTFQPTGIGATQATFTICRATPSVGSEERVVSVSATGKPSTSKTAIGVCP